MKIYTKKGDDKKTDIIGGRVYKDDIIIECLGAIDELAVAIMAASHHQKDSGLKDELLELVGKLRSLSGALLGKDGEITAESVSRVENKIDYYQAKMAPLTDFVLPGETLSGNSLHAARVVARRLERRIVAYSRQAEVASAVIAYVNRLSDLLFVMARYAEEKHV